MRTHSLTGAVGALVLAAAIACGPRPAVQSFLVPDSCEILSAPAEPPDTIMIALLDAVDPSHAPEAQNDGESLVFGLLYEPLVSVDCRGEIRAALASSWRRSDGGRAWTFSIRRDARYWDGTPVAADDVARNWERAVAKGVGVDSVAVIDDHTLEVFFTRSFEQVPGVLSTSALAVTKLSGGSRWPVGTGPYSVSGGFGVGGELWLRPSFNADGPVIGFVGYSQADARDAFESPIDLMITANPDVIDYVAGQPRWVTQPLDWNRTYVLISGARAIALARGETVGGLPETIAATLARDAVRADARAHSAGAWWDAVDMRDLSASEFAGEGAMSTQPPEFRARILFDESDAVARDLAERLAAVSAMDPASSEEARVFASAVPGLVGASPRVTAVAVTTRDLEADLLAGRDLAYILALPRRAADPSLEARAFLNRVPWLAGGTQRFGDLLLPLVDTRPSAIVAGNRVGLAADYYGNVIIEVRAKPSEAPR